MVIQCSPVRCISARGVFDTIILTSLAGRGIPILACLVLPSDILDSSGELVQAGSCLFGSRPSITGGLT